MSRRRSLISRPGKERRTSRARASTALGPEDLCLAICHDLKGPLATASAAVEAFLRRTPGPPSPHLAVARRSLCKADELLMTLPRLLTRREPGEYPLDLSHLLAVVRSDIDLELRLCRGTIRVMKPLPRVLGNPDHLRIALRNLLQNAIRHRRPTVRPDVNVRAWLHPPLCTITISDNGLGLPEGRAQIPDRAGTGLTIARQGIEASGGTLAFTAQPGVGTTAAVTLRALAPGGD